MAKIEQKVIGGSIREYLDSVRGKSIVVSSGSMLNNTVPGKGRYSFIICGNTDGAAVSEYGYEELSSYFCCVLCGFLKASERLSEGSEALFVTTKELELGEAVEDERRLFDELCRKAEERHISAVWVTFDKRSEINKGFITNYINEKAPDFLKNMNDYWGCPLELFEYEILENDDIERYLDEKAGDILIVSAPINTGSKQYKALSMMRVVAGGAAKLLIYEGNEIFTNINETVLTGMLKLAKCLAPANEKLKFGIYIAAQYKLGFSADTSQNRELCDKLYKAIKDRGYKAVEIRMSEANKDFKRRQYGSAAWDEAKTKNEVIRDYIIKHKNGAACLGNQSGDPHIQTYIIENYKQN